MYNLPAKPVGSMPSLREARNAHPKAVLRSTQVLPNVQRTTPSAHQILRFDRETQTIQDFNTNTQVILPIVLEDVRSQKAKTASATGKQVEKVAHGYNLRKRKGPDSKVAGQTAKQRRRDDDNTREDQLQTVAPEVTVLAGSSRPDRMQRASAQPPVTDVEEGEVVEIEQATPSEAVASLKRKFTEDPLDTEVEPAQKRARTGAEDDEVIGEDTIPRKKRNKHKPHAVRRFNRIKSQVVLEMDPRDLVPHYRPNADMFNKSRDERIAQIGRRKTNFMGLNEDCRRLIWGKVFEDEGYKFKILRYCDKNSWKHMKPYLPPSFGCLLINKQYGAEAAEEMYKSVRLELELGKLKPKPVQEFMDRLGASKFGERCERIFFIKKFGLQKVNFGRFKRAKEIVSEQWTINGEKNMDNDDYKNNRVDPELVLSRPEDSPHKGLKQRKCWKDHKKAFDRYQAHIEGRCHLLMKDPEDETFNEEVDRKGCPFDDDCLKLKDTVFVVMLKYKYGNVKGRHARHKEVLYDFYPEQRGKKERIVQTSAFKSKFHKKLAPKKSGQSEG